MDQTEDVWHEVFSNPMVSFIPDDYIKRKQPREEYLADLTTIPYAAVIHLPTIHQMLMKADLKGVKEIDIELPLDTTAISNIVYALYKMFLIQADIRYGRVRSEDLVAELSTRLYLSDKLQENRSKIVGLYQDAHYLKWQVLKDAILYTFINNSNSRFHCDYIAQMAEASNNNNQHDGLLDLAARLREAYKEEVPSEEANVVGSTKKRKK